MLTVITGPMFSGKTAELIRCVSRDKIGGKKVQVFKYSEDARYADKNTMASFDGSRSLAIPCATTQQIIEHLDTSKDVVVFDEIQFFDDEIINIIRALVERGKEVSCAGLNLDFRGEPFPFSNNKKTMADLLVYADKIVKLSAVCTHKNTEGKTCARDATRTQRMIEGMPAPYDSPIKIVGAAELYEARCMSHHIVPGRPPFYICVDKKIEIEKEKCAV